MSVDGRYVCDTNLLISSLLNSNTPPVQTLDLIIDQGTLLFSGNTYIELQTVLQRAKFDRYLTIEKRLDFLNSLISIIEWVEIRENITACRNPKDNQFLDVAVNGKANFIITGDQDLLVLETMPIRLPPNASIAYMRLRAPCYVCGAPWGVIRMARHATHCLGSKPDRHA